MRRISLAVITGSIVAMISTTGCAKKGCTDKLATNYCEKCKKDDGSCTYKGKVVFWWDQTFKDAAVVPGITTTITIYVNGSPIATRDVSQYWASQPNCTDQGAIVYEKDMGKEKSQTITWYYEVKWQGVDCTFKRESATYTLQGGQCGAIKFSGNDAGTFSGTQCGGGA